ncbi:MAG TPA: hypothetical protein VFO38_04260 [Candidatus Saccharimonadales bacterium]|nr:hypothetical protein [Candidatus Saccharimonadales bacterium]
MELARRYSNRPELLNPLVKVMAMIAAEPSDPPEPDRLSVQGREVAPWKITDRFPSNDLDALVAAYQSGATSAALAEQYGMGVTSVKRLLRKRGVRKR